MSKVLVVAAHPDDEALGCGGAMARHAANGEEVNVLFVADGVGARGSKEDLAEREQAAKDACSQLGAQEPEFLRLADNSLDTLPLLEVIQKIEPVIERLRPDVIYTHFAADLNIDHRVVHQAVLTACRPQPGHSVSKILSFEVRSSTEWNTQEAFSPNYFVDIAPFLKKKLAALNCYKKEMRPFPHSRSLEAVEALAVVRGCTVGVNAAEAFILTRSIERL